MSRVVYKYEIPIDGKAHEVPDGRIVLAGPLVLVRPLSMLGMDEQIDTSRALIWAEHQTSDLETKMSVRVFGTGHPIDGPAWNHALSFVAGPYVWHVYAIHPEEPF